MSTWLIVGIIFFVMALIVGNILLLKSSANMKLPSLKDAQPTDNKNTKSKVKEDDAD